METRVLLAAVHWINNSDGFWDVAANWQDQTTLANRVPSWGDDVVINDAAGSVTVTIRAGFGHQNAGTVTLATDESLTIAGDALYVHQPSTVAGGLKLEGGFLSANAPLTLTGTSTWTGGTLWGTVRLNAGGILNIAGDADKGHGSGFTNMGTVIHSGTGDVINVAGGSGSFWNNTFGSVYEFTGDDGRQGTSTFNNLGTVRKAAGSGESRFTEGFNNQGGTVEVTSGRLTLSRGLNTGGVYNASAGAVLDMTGGLSPEFEGLFTGSGAGRVEFASGSFAARSSEATLNFSPGLLHWTGAAMYWGGGAWNNTGTLQISGDFDRAIAARMNNRGTVIHSGVGDVIDVGGGQGSVWFNEAGSVYEFTGDDGRNTTTTFHNFGTIRKTAGTGSSTFTGRLNNTGGSLESDSGRLVIGGTGGLWQATTIMAQDAGVVSVAANIAVTGIISGGGTGRFELTSGSMNSGHSDYPGALGTLNLPANFFHWVGGGITGGGLTNIGVVDVSPLVAGPYMTGAGLINEGLIRHVGPGPLHLNGYALTNRSGGVIELHGDVAILGRDQFGNRGRLINDGVIRRVSGFGTAQIDATLTGTGGVVDVRTGMLNLSSGADSLGGEFLAHAGTIISFTGLNNEHVRWSGEYTGSGPGRLEMNSIFQSGDSGPARLNFPADVFHLVGGQVLGGIVNDGTVQFSAPQGIFGRTGITNNGTWLHTGEGDFVLNANSRIYNRGIFEVRTDADFVSPNDGSFGPMYFHNSGTFRKTGGSGVTAFRHDGFSRSATFNNTGTVEVASGTVSFDDPVSQVSGTTLTDGTWIVRPFATLAMPAAGNISTNRGHVTLDGTGSVFANISAINTNSGTFSLLGGRDFTTAGNLTNSGRLSAGPASVLTVTGNLTELTSPSPLVGWWRGDGNALDSSGNNRHGTIQGTVPFVTGRFGDSFRLNGQHNYVSLGNPAALQLQDFTISAWVRREDLNDDGVIFGYGYSGYAFGMLPNGTLYLTQVGISHVESGSMRVKDMEFHHVAMTKSGSKITFYLDEQSFLVDEYNPFFGFFTNAAIGTRSDVFQPGATFLGRIDEVAVYNRALSPADVRRVASSANLSSIGVTVPTLNFGIAGRPGSGQFGSLNVTGQATLTGAISATRDPGFGPIKDDVYPVMNFASRAGDFTTSIGLPPYFDRTTTATSVVLGTVLSAGDLAVESVSFSGTAVVRTGESIQVTYTARNQGSESLTANWTDTVFLSADNVLSADDALLARVSRSGSLAPNATYTESVTTAIPGLIDDDYFVIVVVNADKSVSEIDRTNNIRSTVTQVPVAVPLLAMDTPAGGTLSPGIPQYYRLSIPDGIADAAVRLTVTAPADSAFDLFAAQGRLPGSSDFDFVGSQQNASSISLLISNASGEPYYIAAVPRRLSAPAAFTVLAEAPQLDLTSAVPQTVGAGRVTIHVRGSYLRNDDLIELVSNGGVRFAALQKSAQDSGNVFATFDLTSAISGSYELVVTRTADSASLPNAVTVEPIRVATLAQRLDLPARFRTGLVFNGAVTYQNASNVDIPAPILVVSTNHEANLRLRRTDPFTSANLVLIGASQSGPAGVLRPGEEWRIPFQPFTATASEIPFFLDYQTADSTDAIDWSAYESSVRPAGTSDADWKPFWLPFMAAAGNTVGGYVRLMAQYATETQARGGNYLSASEVFEVAMRDLYERANASITGQLFLGDASHVLPNVKVLARSANGGTAVAVSTGSDGRFHLPNLPPGTYQLTVDGYLLNAPAQVVVPIGGPAPNVSLTVTRGGIVKGIIRQAANENRLGGVTAQLSGPSGLAVVVANGRGEFEFTGLAAGLYELSVGSGPWAVRQYANIDIDTNSRIRTVIAELSPTATASGRVTASGSPQPGIRIEVFDSTNNLAASPVLTTPDGRYTMAGLNPGHYRLVASKSGFAAAEHSFEITASGDVALPDLNLAPGAVLTLALRDESDDPVSEATVELRRPGERNVLLFPDANGNITVRDLTPGDWEIAVIAPGYLGQATPEVLTSGNNDRLLILATAGRISGLVSDGAGVPIAGIMVNVLGAAAPVTSGTRTVVTGSDGRYTIEDLPIDSYGLTVGNGVGINRQVVDISTLSLNQVADFSVTGGGIVGTVLEADGLTPASGFTVLLSRNNETLTTAITDADGIYRFRSLLPGNYKLQSAGESGITSTTDVTIVADSLTTAPSLQVGLLSLHGQIQHNGQPLAGALVHLIPNDHTLLGQFFVIVSPADGSYEFEGLSALDYTVHVQAAGMVTSRQQLSLNSASTLNVSLTQGMDVSGIVAASGVPVEGSVVIFVDPVTHFEVGSSTTDVNGRYDIDTVTGGSFNVIVRHVDFRTLDLTGIAVAGTGSVIDFNLHSKTTLISGTVLDDLGIPVHGAIIAFVNGRGDTIATAESDFEGHYSKDVLPAETYTVHVQQIGYYPVVVAGQSIVDGVPATANFALQTAGTDDILTPLFPVFAAKQVTDAITEYFKQHNPKPMRDGTDHQPPIPGLTAGACDAKINAYVAAHKAEDNKNAAFKRWEDTFDNFNSTYGYSGAIFATQLANFLGSAAGVAAASGAIATAGTASAVLQGSAVVAQMYLIKKQIGKIYNKATELISGHVDGKSLLKFAASLGKLFAENGEMNHIIDSIGKSTHHASPVAAIYILFYNMIDMAVQTAKSAQHLLNLGDGTIQARDNYLNALDQYLARREYYSSIQCTPKDPPEPRPLKPGARLRLLNRQSGDPNEKESTGIRGTTFVLPGAAIDYTIHFENMPTATAAAQQVIVTDVLDPALDLSTLELGSIGFNGVTIQIPPGRTSFESMAFVDTDPNPVHIQIALDPTSRTLTWTFTSIDPETRELTEDPDAGFLPPNDAANRGQGFVTFVARSGSTSPNGTVIPNSARIYFDVNDPIDTPVITNTIDSGAPTSTVNALPTDSFGTTIPLSWGGSDNGGSGIVAYDVWYSEDSGAYQRLLTATTQTSTSFTGVLGRTYRFFSIARDLVGFAEPYSEVAEASTTLRAPAVPVLLTSPATTVLQTPTISWQPAAGAASYDVWLSNLSTNVSPVLRQTVNDISLTPSAALGIGRYRVWVRSLDGAGNASAWSVPITFQINTRVTMNVPERFQSTARPTFSWTALPGAVRYDLWVDNLSTGQSQFVRRQTVTPTSWTSDVDFPLGRFRVWVRGIDAAGVTATWSVFQEIVVLASPTALSPLGGTFNRRPNFAWTAVPGAVRYELTVVNRNTGATVIHQPSLTGTTWSPTTNLPDDPYRWWVYGVNSQNLYSYASTPTEIYVGGRTELIGPAGTINTSTPTFTWKPVTGVANYVLWVNQIGGQAAYIQKTITGQTSYTHTTALPAGSYRVWVRAISTTGELSPWSLATDFHVALNHSDHTRLQSELMPQFAEPEWLLSVFDDRIVATAKPTACGTPEEHSTGSADSRTDEPTAVVPTAVEADIAQLDELVALDPRLLFLDRQHQ